MTNNPFFNGTGSVDTTFANIQAAVDLPQDELYSIRNQSMTAQFTKRENHHSIDIDDRLKVTN